MTHYGAQHDTEAARIAKQIEKLRAEDTFLQIVGVICAPIFTVALLALVVWVCE